MKINADAVTITISYGDGIGSEIMESTLLILREAAANISIEALEIGERIYNMEGRFGILPSAWEMLSRNKVYLKAPIMIPDVDGYKHVNELIYKKMNLRSEDLLINNMIPNMEGADWLSASANIGEDFAMFETLHDAAPEIAGKDIANPSAMIQASIMLLEHINQKKVAEVIKGALLKTLSDGIHTADMYRRKFSTRKVGTRQFTEEVIMRLGQKP